MSKGQRIRTGGGVIAAPYPFFGYVYTRSGYYHRPLTLRNKAQLENFMFRVVPVAMGDRREVMVTDCNDYAVFHAKNGEILFPKAEEGPGA